MRSITHCPSCQTQFFVTEEQLNKHHGQVRCGQCLHVFDAREQFVPLDEASDTNSTPAPINTAQTADPATTSFDTAELKAKFASSSYTSNGNVFIVDDQPYNPDNPPPKATKKSTLKPLAGKSSNVLKLLFALVLLLTAIIQSIYFLRNDLAIYYPSIKPYLVKICQPLTCSIDLPKKIELIVIDDSDMQEDKTYAGLMRLSSTLINQAAFNQAFPNVEVTLTDVEDKPKLRRIFKPNEYLPEHTDIANGIAAGEEIKIKLAITTSDIAVAGYRVFVTY